MPKKIVYFLAILLSFACTTGEIRRNIFSHPNWTPPKENTNIQRVVIAATHGFSEKTTSFEESIPLKGQLSDYKVQIGGTKILSSYLNILKKRYTDELLLLDTGPHLKEIESVSDINKILDFYTKMDYHAIAFSEREILSLLEDNDHIADQDIPFVNSNIVDISNNKTVQRNSISPIKFATVKGINIAVISASQLEKNQKVPKGLYFEDPVLSFLKQKRNLRKNKVHITLLLANIKSACHTKNPKNASSLNTQNLNCPKTKNEQDKRDSLVQLLKRLPSGSINAIIGHGKELANGFIGKVPIIKVPAGRPYLSRLELFYDKNAKRLLTKKSFIHAPTKLCHNFFLATNDCHIEGNTARLKSIQESHFQLIPAKFLGLEVQKL